MSINAGMSWDFNLQSLCENTYQDGGGGGGGGRIYCHSCVTALPDSYL